jgi:hypothetical protein
MHPVMKALIAVIDETVFRPLVWIVNWRPDISNPYRHKEKK